MRKIEKLEPSRHVKGRFLIWIEGEREPVRVTDNEVLSFALSAGKELDDDTYRNLLNAGGKSSARARGAKMLGERPLSRKELIRRLTEKGESEEDAILAADWLEEIGALNDADYAHTIAQHYARRGYGDRRIRQELQQRGIPREYWDSALESCEEPTDKIVKFLEQKLKTWDGDPKTLKKATDALQRKGFSWSEIQAGLSQYGLRLEEESY